MQTNCKRAAYQSEKQVKLIIAGGRLYEFTVDDYARLASIKGITEVVTGGAKGADECGQVWAEQQGYPVRIFEAQWTKKGRQAGILRNLEMANYADALAVFPGQKGTNHMAETAYREGLKVYDFRED